LTHKEELLTEKKASDAVVRVTVRIPRSLAEAIAHRAIDENTSVSKLSVRAFDAYVKKAGQL